MNGESALLCPNTIKTPTIINIIMIGNNHHFFLTLKKVQTSPNNDLLFPILPQYFLTLNKHYDF